ncbi:MAG: tyrosine--tRNA ligase [Planctomycetota bacterium]
MTSNLYDVLTERGLMAQSTDDAIRERLQEPLTCYIGFDPTADSLHIGGLVPIMGLAWLQRCGHRPLPLIGGATAMIGDPSGKTVARRILTLEQVRTIATAIGEQIGRFLRFGDGPTDARLLNNADWLAQRTWIDVLREYGPHFSVNRMLTMDSVRGRLETGGISFLEFNYMVMQAADFLHLYRSEGCTLQMGGQDQWGNIVMGIELARRLEGASLAGLTMPLVTKPDGSKFGKSEGGNVWLAAERTPVHDFYQFWRNVADADVGRFLRFFTFLDMDTIRRLDALQGAAINEAKEILALEVTGMVHGRVAAEQAQADARKAFGAQDLSGASIPHAHLPVDELDAGIGVLSLFVRSGLCSSNGEARRLIKGRGARINDQVVEDPSATVDSGTVAEGCILLRAGKKKHFRFDVD